MSKITLNSIESLQSEGTAIAALNENFETIQEALDGFLSRDGTNPNQMEADLDMNSNRIMNLAPPNGSNDPVRFVDLQNAAISGLVVPDLEGNEDKILSNDGEVLVWVTSGVGDMLGSNNLSDVDSVATARTNLGLGTAAQAATGTSGATVPLLNANLTWSGTQAYSAGVTFNGGFNVSGTVEARISSTTLGTISTDSIGFRGIPTTTKDENYTFVLNDAGRMLRHTSASTHNYTIPPNVFPVGTVIAIRNFGAGALGILRGVGVAMRIDSSATDGDRSFAQWGYGVITQEATNIWIITGSNLT